MFQLLYNKIKINTTKCSSVPNKQTDSDVLKPDTSVVKSTLNKIYKTIYKIQLKFKDFVTSLQKL